MIIDMHTGKLVGNKPKSTNKSSLNHNFIPRHMKVLTNLQRIIIKWSKQFKTSQIWKEIQS